MTLVAVIHHVRGADKHLILKTITTLPIWCSLSLGISSHRSRPRPNNKMKQRNSLILSCMTIDSSGGILSSLVGWSSASRTSARISSLPTVTWSVEVSSIGALRPSSSATVLTKRAVTPSTPTVKMSSTLRKPSRLTVELLSQMRAVRSSARCAGAQNKPAIILFSTHANAMALSASSTTSV